MLFYRKGLRGRKTPPPFVVYARKAVILREQIWPAHESDVVGLTLQRHLIALLKFSPVELRFCSCKRRGKATFDTPISPCGRSACSRSVAVGLRHSNVGRETIYLIRYLELNRSLRSGTTPSYHHYFS